MSETPSPTITETSHVPEELTAPTTSVIPPLPPTELDLPTAQPTESSPDPSSTTETAADINPESSSSSPDGSPDKVSPTVITETDSTSHVSSSQPVTDTTAPVLDLPLHLRLRYKNLDVVFVQRVYPPSFKIMFSRPSHLSSSPLPKILMVLSFMWTAHVSLKVTANFWLLSRLKKNPLLTDKLFLMRSGVTQFKMNMWLLRTTTLGLSLTYLLVNTLLAANGSSNINFAPTAQWNALNQDWSFVGTVRLRVTIIKKPLPRSQK